MKRILAALAVLLALAAPVHAQKTTTQLTTEINTNLPDNVVGAITPAIARATLIDMLTNAGIDANTLNAQTTAYALAPTDCGKTITLGGTAFYTLTVGAASGFPATCTVVLVNIDAGRGKKMAINGVTFPNSSILWPLQGFTLKNENNIWVVVNPPGRWRLTAGVQFEVNSAGSDANDGLATGAANAFGTINGGIGVIVSVVDANNLGVKLHTNCTAGPITYTGSIRVLPVVGQPIGNQPSANLNPTLTGDTTTPTNCILTSASGATIQAIGGTFWNIEGFQFKNTDGSSPCVLVDQQSWIRAGVVDFNSCNGASGNHIVVENQSGYEPTTNYTISAGASSHILTTWQSIYLVGGAPVITVTGTPAFPGCFASTSRNSVQDWIGASFSGSATGCRFNAVTGGGIDTGGAGATFFPGSLPGTAPNPGWYN